MPPLLFASHNYATLAQALASQTPLQIPQYNLGRFADGEISFSFPDSVRGQHCFVLAASYPPAEHLLELFTLINTLKINQALKITLLLPYFGYAKSDRLERPNQPVNARLFAQFIKVAGADRVVALNLHSPTVESFFDLPLTHLSAIPLFARHFQDQLPPHTAVCTPDSGGRARAEEFARALSLPDLIVIEKTRPTPDQAQVVSLTGSPQDKNIIIVDDLVQTGNTLLSAAAALKDQGARHITVAVTHFVYPAHALEKLAFSPLIDAILTTNSIPHPSSHLPQKMTILPIDPLFITAVTSLL